MRGRELAIRAFAEPSLPRRGLRLLRDYGLGHFLLSSRILIWFLQLRNYSLDVPLKYGGDALLMQAWIQTIMDDGWYLHSNRLGMPWGSDNNDFPQADCLHYRVRLEAPSASRTARRRRGDERLFSADLPAHNHYRPLRPAALWSSCGPSQLAGALLFTFLPFHLERYSHLCLAAYYLVPFMVMAGLWIYLGDSPGREQDGRAFPGLAPGLEEVAQARNHDCSRGGSPAGPITLASSASFFWSWACLPPSLAAGAFAPSLSAACSSGPSDWAALPDVLPSVQFRREHGPNPENFKRTVTDAELYGMKITQMLLPVTNHRLSRLAAIKHEYNQRTIILNENDSATLGIVGSMGFLGLVGWLFLWRRGTSLSLVDGLSLLNLSAVLLATMGGFGALASLLGMAWVRGYNRISVFIGFFALFGVVLLLDRMARRFSDSTKGQMACGALLSGLVVVGLYDQVPAGLRSELRCVETGI